MIEWTPPIQTEYFLSGGGHDFNLHFSGGQFNDLFLNTIGNTREHSGTAGQNGIREEIPTNVNITFHDAVVIEFMYSAAFHSKEARLEQRFRCPETLISDIDDLSIRKFVAFSPARRSWWP